MKILTFFIALLVCVALAMSVTAQHRTSSKGTIETKSRDVRIVADKPHVFIGYLREGKIEPLYDGDSDTRIWLSLHNNSKWRIWFCSNLIPKDYGETEVDYEIERYDSVGETPGTGSSDSCGYYSLRSGKSVTFSVPREHLAEGLAIKIQFRYEWEFDRDGSDNLLEPKHYAYFYSSDIPKK